MQDVIHCSINLKNINSLSLIKLYTSFNYEIVNVTYIKSLRILNGIELA